MHQTVKTVFRLCLATLIFLITLALMFTCAVKIQDILNAEKNFSQKQSFILKSNDKQQFVLVSNNQNPDNALFILIANNGYLAKVSCEHHVTDLCVDAYNKSHTRQINQANVVKAGQWFYIQDVAYRDSRSGKTAEFHYSDAQIQQFYQDDVSALKYTVFGIGLFTAIALYVSSRILRHFRRFLTK
jgi:hypothetical protein